VQQSTVCTPRGEHRDVAARNHVNCAPIRAGASASGSSTKHLTGRTISVKYQNVARAFIRSLVPKETNLVCTYCVATNGF
jgi:hypothetical protein